MNFLIICMVLGFVSFAMAQIISVSQIVSLIRTKNTSGVSVWTYFIFVIAGAMCLIWGFSYYFQEMSIEGDVSIPYWIYQWSILPILCYYITDFCLSSTMLVIKTRHLHLSKKLKMNELDLAEYLKDKQKQKYLRSGHKFYNHINFPIFVLLGLLFAIVILFAVLFTIYVRFKPTQTTDWAGYPWVVPTSLLAAFLWEAISWPQFIKSIRQKDTSGISMNWAIFMPASLTVAFGYALALALKTGDFSPDTIGGLVFNGMIVNYGILIIKIINKKNAKKLGLSEVQYTKKYLIPAWKKKQAAKARKAK